MLLFVLDFEFEFVGLFSAELLQVFGLHFAVFESHLVVFQYLFEHLYLSMALLEFEFPSPNSLLMYNLPYQNQS